MAEQQTLDPEVEQMVAEFDLYLKSKYGDRQLTDEEYEFEMNKLIEDDSEALYQILAEDE